MKLLKFSAAAAFSIGIVAAIAGSAWAAPPAKGTKYVNGALCSYTAGKRATIAKPSSSCAGPTVTIRLNKHTKLVDETSPATPVTAGDAVAAFLEWKHGRYTAKKLEYGTSPFVFRHQRFSGKFVSFTGACPAGVLTIRSLGNKGKDVSFSTDSKTVYADRGNASTCAAVTAAYKMGERINVTAGQNTDNSLYAERVNANPRSDNR